MEELKIVRIFIVDDCEIVVQMYETFLTMKGYEVVAKAFDGNQAIELYQTLKIPPDIILMDYRMPEKDGLLVAREILSLNPNCKIIFISADCSIKTQALNIGIVFFFENPIPFLHLQRLRLESSPILVFRNISP